MPTENPISPLTPGSGLGLANANSLTSSPFTPFEVKTKNRFVLQQLNSVPAFLINKTKRPAPTFETNKIEHVNVDFKLKGGKTTWGNIEVSIYDAVDPSGAYEVMSWILQEHDPLTGADGYGFMSTGQPNGAGFYKQNVQILTLDPLGNIIETWSLYGAFITETPDFGDLDWASGEVQMITINIAFDYALLTVNNSDGTAATG